MATVAYPYEVRDLANTSGDNRMPGLTPTLSAGKTLTTTPTVVLASTVAIVPIGAGVYVAFYDAEANGDAAFPIDWGSSLTNPNDRYGSLILTRQVLSASGLDAVAVEAGLNARQGLATMLAAVAGMVSGAGTGVVVIKGGNTSTTRITATTDNAGKRSSVILTPPA
jgi:hypothetical protein